MHWLRVPLLCLGVVLLSATGLQAQAGTQGHSYPSWCDEGCVPVYPEGFACLSFGVYTGADDCVATVSDCSEGGCASCSGSMCALLNSDGELYALVDESGVATRPCNVPLPQYPVDGQSPRDTRAVPVEVDFHQKGVEQWVGHIG